MPISIVLAIQMHMYKIGNTIIESLNYTFTIQIELLAIKVVQNDLVSRGKKACHLAL